MKWKVVRPCEFHDEVTLSGLKFVHMGIWYVHISMYANELPSLSDAPLHSFGTW